MTTKPNSFLSFLSVLFLIAGAGAAAAGYGFYMVMKAGPLKESKTVLIPRGIGVSEIGATLEKEGVIDHALLFKVAARLKSDLGSLKAGEYNFPAGISMEAAMQMMADGEVADRKLVIREGLTSYQIVKILNAADGMEGEITAIPPEGSILPETYHFIAGDSRADKLKRMQDAMRETIAELWPKRVEGLPFSTPEEALTLASIIEMETGVSDERRKVAGVFVNRLRKGMVLQTDPTVIYAITKGKIQNEGRGPLGRRLLRKDLQIDDPYNTYKYAGLPPGPIANPGRASIEAALNPETHDYLYFVADGTGGHAFGKTLAEHNANVLKWRAIRRQQQN